MTFTFVYSSVFKSAQLASEQVS